MNEDFSLRLSRRAVCAGLAASGFARPARAQAPAKPSRPPAAPSPAAQPTPAPFDFGEVLETARRLAAAPFQPPGPSRGPFLDYDDYRDVRFRPDRDLLAEKGSKFRLELFPIGAEGTTPVAVNVVSDGVSRPIVFSQDLLDFGRLVTPAQRAAIDGFAGLRLRYPLNKPNSFDEVVAFLRASYFRFIGRGQIYGQSMRGLAIGAGDPARPEEFPIFREFWVMQPAPDANTIELMALLDSQSLSGAYRFAVTPGKATVIEMRANLFPRVAVDRLGFAPITSMYLTGESGPRILDAFRPEVHDASGLLIARSAEDWTWRPLRNPAASELTQFPGPMSGFGLMQRPRNFDDYEDLEADYQLRPSYWVKPITGFEKGSVELVELSASSETSDNIVAQWRPADVSPAGRRRDFALTISTHAPEHKTLAHVAHTLIARPGADMAGAPPGAQRFFIDFAGEALSPFLAHPESLTLDAKATGGQAQASILAHPESPQLRATLDVTPEKGLRVEASLALLWLGRPVSETWTFPVQG